MGSQSYVNEADKTETTATETPAPAPAVEPTPTTEQTAAADVPAGE